MGVFKDVGSIYAFKNNLNTSNIGFYQKNYQISTKNHKKGQNIEYIDFSLTFN